MMLSVMGIVLFQAIVMRERWWFPWSSATADNPSVPA